MAPFEGRGQGTLLEVEGPTAPGFSGDLPSSSGTAGGLHPLHATTCPALGDRKHWLAGLATCAACGRDWCLCSPITSVWRVCQRKVHLLPTCEGRGLSACGDGPPSGG